MFPAADFITVFKSGAFFTSLLLLEPLFSDKAAIRPQHTHTSLSNPPDGRTLQSALHINNRLEYIFVPFPLWQILSVYTGRGI